MKWISPPVSVEAHIKVARGRQTLPGKGLQGLQGPARCRKQAPIGHWPPHGATGRHNKVEAVSLRPR